MTKEELTEFLKKNLSVYIWKDYDGCNSPRINVSLILCDEEISISSDYLE